MALPSFRVKSNSWSILRTRALNFFRVPKPIASVVYNPPFLHLGLTALAGISVAVAGRNGVSVSIDICGCRVGGSVFVVVEWGFILGLGAGLAVRNCAPGTAVPFEVSVI